MAFNLATFKTRSLTAVIFVVIMLVGLLWNHWSFFILFSIIHFGCWVEYQKLVGLIDPGYAAISRVHKYGVMLAGWCIMLYFTNDSYNIFGLQLHALGWWLGLLFVFILPITELLFAKEMRLKNIAHSAFGLIYISLSWGLMMDISSISLVYKTGEWYRIIPIVLIASIWINDTMAYIVGSLIGKTPFSKISPKKTWEGTAGGAILCVAVIGLVCYYVYPFNSYRSASAAGSTQMNLWHWLIIAAIAAVAGTAGDLLESKLKRLANVKDSGSIMPGHGGFLDRFDSLVLATPFVWLYVVLVL
jgi:phosphatidate cytidylyltransferase